MLPFVDWKSIGVFLKDNIAGVNSFVYGTSEEDIQGKINKLNADDYPVLVGIIPSSDSNSRNTDDRSYRDICFYYVLVPIRDRTEAEEDAVRIETQDAIQQIEHLIFDNYVDQPLFRHIDGSTIHYDPEFGIWNCSGWSIAFLLDNNYIAGQ